MQVRQLDCIQTLGDAEFSVFSQWGEDGIIEWLIAKNGDMPETFVEFGVETYHEANTRFLLAHRNWRGLIIDGSEENIDVARADNLYWRHDLQSTAKFITTENINQIIASADFSGEIGILSVDIDGNDYWVWDSINCVNPQFLSWNIIVALEIWSHCQYRIRKIFTELTLNSSNLYWGASIAAFERRGKERGYTLLGSTRTGSNAFFIRNDRLANFDDKIADKRARPSRFREGRLPDGKLSLVSGMNRTEIIGHKTVVNTETGISAVLKTYDKLYSDYWKSLI